MLEKTKQDELTKEQIEEYVLKRPNVKRGGSGLLEIIIEGRDPYIHINDREESHSIFLGKKITPIIKVHLDYCLNQLKCKLIEKIFSSNPEINVFWEYKEFKSTYVQKKLKVFQILMKF